MFETTSRNIFKPVERPDILRPSRITGKRPIGSPVSNVRNVGNKKSALENLSLESVSDSDDDDILSCSLSKDLRLLANLPEETFLRRHELYVTDIEDSTDVVFAIAPTIR